ncbi:2-deoxy-scyllo-inosose synthase [Catenulispora sp. GP43]|uniref:2-deoxy-scyllo-inosose synthase n=1 Tax=Catenulispora sp. GP43 TaxID=3156263 RepID=UPI003517128C
MTVASEQDWLARTVDLGGVAFPYRFGYDCVDRIAWSIGRLEPDRILVVTDDTVAGLHGDTLFPELAAHAPVEVISMPAGEGMKSQTTLASHLERCIAAGATRGSVVVSFGGGVPGNLAGLMAALLYRGVRLVHVPTTTVAAMDSTLSLKQAVNSAYGKNHIGTYHTPQGVFTDVRFLQTLPERERRSGLCEAVKNCLAIRPQAIEPMRELLASGTTNSAEALLWLLDEGLTAKTGVTAGDPKEQGRGLILEYGHTVGHAVELCDQRIRGAQGVSHGEAVALGMLAAARIGQALGTLSAPDVAVHDDLVALLGAASCLPSGVEPDEVVSRVGVDNKRGYLSVGPKEAAMVVLDGLGEPLGERDLPLVSVPMELVAEAVAGLVDQTGEGNAR